MAIRYLSFINNLPDASNDIIEKVRKNEEIKTVKDLRCVLNSPSPYSYIAIYANGNIREFNNPWDLQISGLSNCGQEWPKESPKYMESFVETMNSPGYYYHYTKFESALKILESERLKFSKLSSMDDLYESTRMVFVENREMYETAMAEIDRYKQISLITDNEEKRKYRHKGFDILPMWGCYAEKGNGVCFVLDKTIIDDEIARLGKRNGNPIKYGNFDNTISIPGNRPVTEIKRSIKKLFFTKQKEWEFEQEFRIIKRCESDDDSFLPLNGAIQAIILANNNTKIGVYNSCRYRFLHCAYPDIPIFVYGLGNGERNLLFGQADDKIWIKDRTEHYWSRYQKPELLLD